jgi:hypothetical protein
VKTPDDAASGRQERRALMKWFRVYSEARTDAKLESLTDAQHRVWFRLMCFAGDQGERGDIMGYDEDLLAVEVARGDVDLLRCTLERLVKLRIIATGDGVRFVNWEKRQYDKPSDAPEQTRERKRKSRASSIEESSVTPMSRDVTPHKQIQSTDTDTEPEGENDAPARVVVADTPFAVYQAFVDETAGDDFTPAPKWKEKQIAIGARLLEQGYGDDKVRRCVRFMLSQEWRTSPFDLGTVEKFIGTWEASGMPERDIPKRGGAPREETREEKRARHMQQYGHLFEREAGAT